MTEARIGWGGKVYLSTDNTEANLTLLAEVVDTTFPQDETDEVEATHLNSPGRRKEFLAGLIDGGEVTINLNYVPGAATDLLLTAAKEAGTTRKVNMQMPQAALAIRSGTPSYSLLSRVLWALFREHHQNMTLPQCLSIVMDKGKDGEKVGFALDALLDRCFPLATEDRKAKNPPKRRGRSATSASVG
jgi:hypothetical protein